MDNQEKNRQITLEELHRTWFGCSKKVDHIEQYQQEYWLEQPPLGRVVDTSSSGFEVMPKPSY